MNETTTKTLQLNFKNTQGKSTRISFREPDGSVDAQVVKEAIDHFVKTEAFQDASGDMYDQGVNGQEIVRTVNEIYKVENE